jgi:hypothetical protein
MTFAEAQMTYVHLISWPSVWLPPTGTNKILLLGYVPQQIDELAQKLSNDFGTWSWALYHVPDCDINNQEHVDWLVVNNHIRNVLVNGKDSAAIILALLLDRSNTFCAEQAPIFDRLCEQKGWLRADLAQAIGFIVSNQSQEGLVK